MSNRVRIESNQPGITIMVNAISEERAVSIVNTMRAVQEKVRLMDTAKIVSETNKDEPKEPLPGAQ
jgi:hypothetical protein